MSELLKKLSVGIKSSIALLSTVFAFFTAIDLGIFLSYSIYNKTTVTTESVSWSWGLFINQILLSLFILSHSILALPEVKNLVKQYNFGDLERCFYIIITCVTLQALFKNWIRIEDITLWEIDTQNTLTWLFFWILHIHAWIVIYIGNICMDVAELIGIKQVYYSLIGNQSPIKYKSLELQQLYLHMRHPSFTMFLIIFWVVPVMTLDRLLLALILSLYMKLAWKTDNRDIRYQQKQHLLKFQ